MSGATITNLKNTSSVRTRAANNDPALTKKEKIAGIALGTAALIALAYFSPKIVGLVPGKTAAKLSNTLRGVPETMQKPFVTAYAFSKGKIQRAYDVVRQNDKLADTNKQVVGLAKENVALANSKSAVIREAKRWKSVALHKGAEARQHLAISKTLSSANGTLTDTVGALQTQLAEAVKPKGLLAWFGRWLPLLP